MSEDLNPVIIKRTQDTLGKYVKKPNLTAKLLKKPPFRFLHDVFSAIIRDTKCFVGLYTFEELNYENIKDRDDKMKFLQKMIDVVKLTTGSSLAIRTSKIVAGHEPEKTNELLQLIGDIIESKLDWQSAVEQVLAGKVAPKELHKKPKDSTIKAAKDVKSKDKHNEKSNQKATRTVEQKKSNASVSKILTTTNKDDKVKINKTKDNISRQLPSKEKAIKVGKEAERPVKKSKNESSNNKPKLKKSESQSSNKSSPSLKTRDSHMELKSTPNETECSHKEEKNFASNSVVNEIPKSGQISISNQKDSRLQLRHLEAESLPTEKSSAGSMNTNTIESAEGLGEQFDGKESEIKLETSKETDTIVSSKQDLSAPNSIQEQHQSSKKTKSDKVIKNLEEPSSPVKQKRAEKSPLPAAPPPTNSSNEIKRESTFTRENSIDSNRSSLVNRPRTSLRPPSARPPSARPGAPRRRDKNIEIILQPNDQIKMSGIQVKLETFGDLNDDDENLVIIENSNANDVTIDYRSNLTESSKIIQDEMLEQGHLVQQILETQKELVQQPSDAGSQQKNEKDSVNSSVMRQTSARHMNNLRDVIQNITKSVNPLGKLMDFIPEDIDAMQLEFTLWRDTYTQAANELKREKSLTESATEPMKNQLLQIEANILEYKEMINASRVKILQNSEKILKMLTT